MAKTSGSPHAISRIEIDKESCFYGLLPAFRRLGQRLKLLAEARDASASELDPQPYPGLTVSKSQLSRLLEQEPGMVAFTGDDVLFDGPLFDPSKNANSELIWLAREYELSTFDLDVILIALATELDLSYEKVFGYLQDDITRKRPTVDLALHLLCSSNRDRELRLSHFTPDGPLVKHKILQPDPDQGRSIVSRELRLDEGIINLLLDVKSLDPRLGDYCQLIQATVSLADVPVDVDLKRALQVLTTQTEVLRLHFRGPASGAKRQTAEALAAQTSSKLLIAVDIERALAATDFDQSLRLILREALFRGALIYFENVDVLLGEERAVLYRQFLKALNHASSTVIISGDKPLGSALRAYEVQFRIPEFAQRRSCWEANLSRHSVVLDSEALDSLAGSFRLTTGEIETAVTAAIDRAQWRAAEKPVPFIAQPTPQDLFATARSLSSHNLGRFARKIELKYEWADLVLPADQVSQLSEICSRYKHRQVVYGNWGFGRKLSLGRGLSALFSGHPGTGKTMAAEVIANELLLDLYKIDLSQVVSKYIGETEKSLNSIFQEAQASNAILFFDEADALFGKRTEVKDSHDRYANIEVSYLLQKMEEYDGIAILATNLRKNIDDAFLRRMQFIIEFPFPDEEQRRRIWEVIFPREAPIGDDVNFSALARTINLAGGNLKNIALAAAFYAAGDGGVIRKEHMANAIRREFQKLGQSWSDE